MQTLKSLGRVLALCTFALMQMAWVSQLRVQTSEARDSGSGSREENR